MYFNKYFRKEFFLGRVFASAKIPAFFIYPKKVTVTLAGISKLTFRV